MAGAGVLAVVAVVASSARALRVMRRRAVPLLPLRPPVDPADQDAIRALVAGERNVEAVEFLRRRYRLTADDARAVAGDVAGHRDYPPDWRTLAVSLDDDLRRQVRDLVAQGRRSAALRLVHHRFDLPMPDADSLVTALTEQSPGDGE
jgi:hypothetical protein